MVERLSKDIELIEFYSLNFGGCIDRVAEGFQTLLVDNCSETMQIVEKIRHLKNFGDSFHERLSYLFFDLKKRCSEITSLVAEDKLKKNLEKYNHYKLKLARIVLDCEILSSSGKTVPKSKIKTIQRVSIILIEEY